MLEKEFKYYLDHQKELLKKYGEKYIYIVGEEVVGPFDNQFDAYLQAIKKHKEGTFLIQLCSQGDESYTQTFHSRVVFS